MSDIVKVLNFQFRIVFHLHFFRPLNRRQHGSRGARLTALVGRSIRRIGNF